VYKFLGFKQKVFNPFDGLSDTLEKLKVKTKDYKHDFGSLMDSIKDGLDGLGIDLSSFNIFGGSGGGSEPIKLPVIPEVDFSAIRDLEDSLDEEDIEVEVSPKIKFDSFMKDLDENLSNAASAVTKFADNWGDAINTGLDIINQGLDNQMVKLENKHARESELIANSNMNAEDQATAQEALEKKTAIAKGKILRKQAIMEKAAAIISATINGAQAMTKVSAQTGVATFAFSPIMAALVAAQIATIASAPIPAFAQGGLVTGATMGLVGEGRGTTMSNPEVIAPLDKLKGMLGDTGGTSYIPNVTISGDDLLIVFDRANRRKDRR
jgi:hypothetical protein